MDFVSLGVSSPFYILHKGEKLSLQVGTVKSKTDPKPQFPTQTPGIFTGVNTSPNVIDVIVNVNGTDKQMIPLCGYKYIGVNSCSDYPRTAHALAYYLSGQTCQQQRAEQLGWGPANKAVQNMDAVTSDPVLNAVKDQAAFAVPQVRVAPTFWGPMGNLGTTLMSDSTDPSRVSTIRTLLSRTIRNIRDE